MGDTVMSYDMQASDDGQPPARNGTKQMTWIGAVDRADWSPDAGNVILMVDASNGWGEIAALQCLGVDKGPGLIGQGGSNQGVGVVGIASDPDPNLSLAAGGVNVFGVNAGVYGMSLGSGSNDIGIRGENVWDDNAPGHQAGQGQGVGVLGVIHVQNGVGVRGENDASTGQGVAVAGESSVGTGVQGLSHGDAGIGVQGLANDGDTGIGVHGQANGPQGLGVFAQAEKGTAVNAVSGTGIAVVGESPQGVAGVFAAGPAGVRSGDAPPGRAGVFISDSKAQVRLVPHQAKNPLPLSEPYAAQALIPKGVLGELPANGQAGDLLCATWT
jgi:hypothetical protein